MEAYDGGDEGEGDNVFAAEENFPCVGKKRAIEAGKGRASLVFEFD